MNTSSSETIRPVFGKILLLFVIPVLFTLSCATGTPPAGVPAELPADGTPEAAKAAEPEPTDTPAILAKIAALLGKEEYDGALALFDRIDPADAETADIRLLKASALGSAGRTDDARAIVADVSSREPDNMDALYVLSALEGGTGKDRERKNILERIVKTDPKYVKALVDLGNLAFGGTRALTTAAGYFDRALREEPDNRDALVGRAQVYRYSRDPKNAERLLNRAVRLYPQWAGPLHERARLYRGAGYPVQAMEDIDKAKALEPGNYWIAVDRGGILLDLNRKQESLEEFSRAVALDPGSFIAYVYTAGIKDEFGDYEGAERDYTTLTKLRPEYYFAFEGLGVLKMRKQLWAEARDNFLEAYRQAPKEPGYALLAAMNWMRAGRQNDPRQFLETALRRVERESPDWYLLRLYHDLAGDNDIVIRLDREKNLDTKAKSLYYLAHYYDIRGNKSLADKYFLQVKDLDRRAIPEWRLNELALEERDLKAF
ncbi:MAG: tetratricopeptide repeat protein [Treponema sp.]|jgi:tetratricopeptide (TPR) repeat protein|nr:tetratricopeptide repeat protein [Treponema sp.]